MSMKRAVTLHTVADTGDAPGEVRVPGGVSVNRIRGRIFLTDLHSHLVNIYGITPPHHFISSFGGHGRGDGEFNYPTGIVCDSNERVIVCDRDNGRVQIFTSEGVYETQFADERCVRLRWVDVDDDDNIYVGDVTESGASSNQIHVFTPQGQYMRTLPVHGRQFTIHRHRLYRRDGESNGIHVHSLDGTHERTVTVEGVRLWWWGGITATSDGRLLVSDWNDNICIVSADSGNVKSRYKCEGDVRDLTLLDDNTFVIVYWDSGTVRTVEVQEENKLLPALNKKEEEFFKVKRSKLHPRVCSKVKNIFEDEDAVKMKDHLYPDFSRPRLASMNGLQDIWNALEDAGKIKPGEDYEYLKTLLNKIGNRGITANSEIQNLEGLFRRREIGLLFDDSDSDDVVTQPQEGADISSSKRDSEAVERAAPETRVCLPLESWWTRTLPLLKTEIPSLYSNSAYKLYIFIFIICLFHYKPMPSFTESDTSKLLISYVFELCMYLLILSLIYYKYRQSSESEGGQREQEERNTGERLLPQWMRGALTWLSSDKGQKFLIFIAAAIRFWYAYVNMPNYAEASTLQLLINRVYIVCNSGGIVILFIHNYIKPMSLRRSKTKRSKLHSRVCSKVKDILEDEDTLKMKDHLYPDFRRARLASMNGFQDIWNALEDAGKIKPGEDYEYLKAVLKKIGSRGITANEEVQNLEGLFRRREILFDDSDSDDVVTQPQEGVGNFSSKRDSEAVERATPETRTCLSVERWWTRTLPLLKTELPSLYSDSAYKLYIFIFILCLFHYKPMPTYTESDTSKLLISYVFELCLYLFVLTLIYYKYRQSSESEGGQREQEERNTGKRLLPQWMRRALTWLSSDKGQKFLIFIAATCRFWYAYVNMPNYAEASALQLLINRVYIVCNSFAILILFIHNYIKPMSLRGSKTKPDKDEGLLPR